MTTEEKMLEVIKKIAEVKKEYKKAINQIAAYEYEQEIRKLTDELVGLHDALERRPAVQVAKTISERANKYWQDKYPYLSGMYMCDAIKTVFTESATDQRKIDIDKACEWLESANEGIKFLMSIGGTCDGVDIEQFRKDMEE